MFIILTFKETTIKSIFHLHFSLLHIKNDLHCIIYIPAIYLFTFHMLFINYTTDLEIRGRKKKHFVDQFASQTSSISCFVCLNSI